ncbi:MAG: HAD family hydrolase [Candidatus Bathyarchaeota archaeon]|nr:HAD family hydrolase [Candidatus Bathyarchaeum sp.]
MIKAVIFDLDGTLVSFNLDVNSCRTKVIQYLTEQGIPRSLFSMKETAFDMLVKVKKYLTANGISNQKFVLTEKVVFSIVESFELESAKTTEMFQGVPEMLQALKDLNLKIALCTISGEKAAGYILNRFNLGNFFDAVFPRESVSAVKPSPVHVEAVLSTLNVKSNEAILVGDSIKDVTAAVKLNVISVGVTTGLSSMDELMRSGAHYIASSVSDLPKLILQINEQV